MLVHKRSRRKMYAMCVLFILLPPFFAGNGCRGAYDFIREIWQIQVFGYEGADTHQPWYQTVDSAEKLHLDAPDGTRVTSARAHGQLVAFRPSRAID